MTQIEWNRALETYRANHERCQKNACLVCMAIRNTPATAYEVASRLYASDKLDNVPGINGPTRHDVLVAWLHEHPMPFINATGFVEQEMWRAGERAVRKVERFV